MIQIERSTCNHKVVPKWITTSQAGRVCQICSTRHKNLPMLLLDKAHNNGGRVTMLVICSYCVKHISEQVFHDNETFSGELMAQYIIAKIN